MRDYGLYIGGEDRETGNWIYSIRASALIRDPIGSLNLKRSLELGEGEVTEDVFGRCAFGSDADNEDALRAAKRASREFARWPLEARHRIVLDIHHELERRAAEFVELLVAEGHPRRLAQWEVSGMLRGADPPTLEWYVKQLRQDFDVDGKRLNLVRKPDGVVCVNPPQNAAGSNSALGGLALLAGNAVVVKAPRSTPLSVMCFYRDIIAPILERHGAPPGTLNIITGDTRRIIKQWLKSELVDDILFFGDSVTGLQIGQECIQQGKKPILELAGNDGFVVWKDADVDAAAKALTECFFGSSQICMVPKYCVAHPEIAEELIDRMKTQAAGVRPGFPEDEDTLLSPVLKTDKFYDFLAEAKEAGCAILTGGRRVGVDGEPSEMGLFFEPTLIRVDGLRDSRRLSCVREETFFPMLPIVVPETADDETLLEETLDFLNANEYGLRNSVWTRDDRVAERFAAGVINGGLLKINDSHIGFVSYLSTHGGTGKTGGPVGELNYVALRTTHLQGIVWGDGRPEPLDPRLTSAPGRFDREPAPDVSAEVAAPALR